MKITKKRRRVALRSILTFVCLIALHLSSSARNASWISADDTTRNNPNTWIEFRKDFKLNRVPTLAIAKIAADTKYWLWINDRPVVFEGGLKRGPNPSDTYYDSVDLTPYLKKGDNRISLLLWHFGKPGFSHKNSGCSGMLFDAPSIDLVSDSSWQSRIVPEYQTAPAPKVNFRLAESNLRYDSRLKDTGKWAPSVELGGWGSAPWNNLVERPIPQWKNSGLLPVDTFSVKRNNGNIEISARLPYNMQLTPYIDITDPTGGTVVFIETDHVLGGSEECVRAEYVTSKGRQSYESLGWMNGDELRIRFPEDSEIVLNGLAYRETGYDADFEGSFVSSDDFVNQFWQKAMRTLYVNMRDNYFDCPDRERAQWWGDVTILMGQSFYQLSPAANALMRKAIRELMDWQKEDGTLYSPIPSENWVNELPAQMLAAISTYGLWYYYMHTADKETIEYAYPAMRKYLSLWSLDPTGLTEFRKGGWSWGDWGTDIDMRLLLGAWHYLALESAKNIALTIGREEDVADYDRQTSSIREGFDKCWNGFAYRHPSHHKNTDDRVQALAVLVGFADESKYDRIFDLFKSQEYASPYMEKYVLEALVKMGHGDYALERFKKRFEPMVADSLHTTLFEGWEEGGYGGGSTNHAWSGGMLTVVAENICGVRPTAPGWSEFEICPDPVISECDIRIPTVKGMVQSGFRDTDTEFIMNVEIPAGTKANVRLPQEDYTGMTVNGKHAGPKDLTSLKSGRYTIRCSKKH